jgi:hypothetical protein
LKEAAILTLDIEQAKQKRKYGKTPELRHSSRNKISNSEANNAEHTRCFKVCYLLSMQRAEIVYTPRIITQLILYILTASVFVYKDNTSFTHKPTITKLNLFNRLVIYYLRQG